MLVHETALIDLAYAATMVAIVDLSGVDWDKPVAGTLPSEYERECYRLATQLGLRPMMEADTFDTIHQEWRRQLRNDRQKDIFDLGMLLVRQHTIVTHLQCHPDIPQRAELCYLLDQILRDLTSLFTRFILHDAIAKLPVLPLPGAPDTWKTWSGDALREAVMSGLGAPQEP